MTLTTALPPVIQIQPLGSNTTDPTQSDKNPSKKVQSCGKTWNHIASKGGLIAGGIGAIILVSSLILMNLPVLLPILAIELTLVFGIFAVVISQIFQATIIFKNVKKEIDAPQALDSNPAIAELKGQLTAKDERFAQEEAKSKAKIEELQGKILEAAKTAEIAQSSSDEEIVVVDQSQMFQEELNEKTKELTDELDRSKETILAQAQGTTFLEGEIEKLKKELSEKNKLLEAKIDKAEIEASLKKLQEELKLKDGELQASIAREQSLQSQLSDQKVDSIDEEGVSEGGEVVSEGGEVVSEGSDSENTAKDEENVSKDESFFSVTTVETATKLPDAESTPANLEKEGKERDLSQSTVL